jgi:thioesterase domain-containing protein
MVPWRIAVLNDLPLTPNGKLDRNALPNLAAQRSEPKREPRPGAESITCEAFSHVLGVERVSPDDDFFVLGGNSLAAVRVLAYIRARFGTAPPIGALLQHPTPASLVMHWVLPSQDAIHTIRTGEAKLPSLVCVHPGGGNTLCYRELALHLELGQTVLGIDLPSDLGIVLEGSAPSIATIAARHADALSRAEVRAPWLCGWSLGGVLAFELAQQMTSRGCPPAGLILLDADPRWANGEAWSQVAQDPARVVEMAVSGVTGGDPSSTSSWRDWQSRRTMEDALQWARTHSARAGLEPAEMESRLQTHIAQLKSLEHYRPRPTFAGLYRFIAAGTASVWMADSWQDLVGRGTWQIEVLEGADHYTMLKESSSLQIAHLIDSFMRMG